MSEKTVTPVLTAAELKRQILKLDARQTVWPGSGGSTVEFVGPSRRHVYKRGRTQCGNRTYKTGFSPCELALPEGAMAPLEGYHGDPLCIAKVPYDSAAEFTRPARGTQTCGKYKNHRYHTDEGHGIYNHDYKAGPRLSDADMQAAADLLGLSVCHYVTDDERKAATDAFDGYKGDGHQLRTDLPHPEFQSHQRLRSGEKGRAMSEPVRFHEYRMNGVQQQTLCLDKWYVTGTAPCEIMTKDDGIYLDPPACEPEDLEAARILLNQPRLVVCRAKGRASWQDKRVPPGTLVAHSDGTVWLTTEGGEVKFTL